MEKERKTDGERSDLQENIRKNVERKLRESLADAELSVSPKTDAKEGANAEKSDDFWNLGKPKPRVYKKPDFSDTPVEMTDVTNTAEIEYEGTEPEKITAAAPRTGETDPARKGHSRLNYRPADRTDPLGDLFDDLPADRAKETTVTAVPSGDGMPIPERNPAQTHTTTVQNSGRQTVVHDAPPRYTTGSYRHQGGWTQKKKSETTHRTRPAGSGNEVLATHHPGGLLIREVEVRSWSSDVDFYERFLENAEKSHAAQPSVPYTADYPPVKYFSYVPQYSHMSRSQLDYYRWIRENIRHGRFPVCDPSYIQLYIYEILNLPDLIPPAYGAAQLAGIWLAYRKTEPRIDGYLCEWLPDYCMMHACPMPDALKPILPEIVPKAQFKEFYFDFAAGERTPEDALLLARILIENSSDYDYRRSRYYGDHRDAYETHLPRAAAAVIEKDIAAGRGVFSLEKTYKMTRDSYCGAIVSIDVKRRLNIEFRSFTRSADTRRAVTAIVKYAENRLRPILGIKAKLGVDGITQEDTDAVDAYFAPMTPGRPEKPKEDRYMPDNYLKNYEAEDSGFDFGTAAEIERMSWQNTTLLTGEDFADETFAGETSASDAPESADVSDGSEKRPETEEKPAVPAPEIPEPAATEPLVTASETAPEAGDADGDALVYDALAAALDGRFHMFCRERQIYDGVLADRVNTRFLDLLGDIVLEEDGGSYALIEDYREDIETWMKNR
ncbi:MAG: TerB N-terminal domain-containing protein [Eubacteriales bacterium]